MAAAVCRGGPGRAGGRSPAGRPRTVLTEDAIAEILAATVTPPPEALRDQGITHWSARLAGWLAGTAQEDQGQPRHDHTGVAAVLPASANPRITLHFTPASCSWLNLVECFFSVITR